jgi:hypothetical protein
MAVETKILDRVVCILHLVTSNLMMEATHSSETLVSVYERTRCHNPEYHNLYSEINCILIATTTVSLTFSRPVVFNLG